MLPRELRMRDGSDFAVAVRQGRRAGSRSVVCHWAGAEDHLRVGFVVSKAVGGSVVRNQVKRRLRHVVRELAATSVLPATGLLVVRALPAAATLSSAELDGDVRRTAQRATRVADAVPS